MKRMLRWELAGFFVISLVGSALHFVFGWSGGLRAVALIGAVNESTWEHLKMSFWPGLIFAAVEYSFLRAHTTNFWVAKAVALWVTPLTISVLFYAYEYTVGGAGLFYNLAIFFLAIGLGQWASCRILLSPPVSSRTRQLAHAALVLLITAFCLFTYYPPNLFLFIDPNTGKAGIPAL